VHLQVALLQRRRKMPKHGKKFSAIRAQAPRTVMEIEEAIKFLKDHPVAKFDESVEVAFRMGIDPRKSENAIRSTVSLPHGTGKKVRVLVFAAGAAADAARAAGAEYVGNEDMIEKVKGGFTDFDVAIATPEAMQEVRKLGRVLGPRGLMPNPKTGTVSDDTAAAVEAAKGGRVEFRMDRHGNVAAPVGKLSFPVENLCENVQALASAVRASKPTGAKGIYIKNCSVSSTMGVGLRVNIKE
jgi:large subunit ribosomal protein L1